MCAEILNASCVHSKIAGGLLKHDDDAEKMKRD